MLKRIWGLPGEQLMIGDGEMWIDGKLLQKSLDELRSVAVPLDAQWTRTDHDSASNGEPPRERFEWQCTVPAPVYPDAVPQSEWLHPATISDAAPIPLLPGTPPLESQDILLRIQVQQSVPDIGIEYTYRGVQHHVTLNSSEKSASSAGQLHKRIDAEGSVEVAFCDGRLLVAGDDRTLTPEDLTDLTSAENTKPPSSSLSITATHGVIRQITLYRDIILRSSHRSPGDHQQFESLGPGEYFVLGDNQPFSDDSRGPLAAIARQQILGTATPP
ncbi:MAG: hypothetical protein Aurels2KO_40900 [Aureliella sp.]